MRDLSTFKGCPAPQPVTLSGRFVIIEPYDKASHLQPLWDALGGLGINPLLKYFACPEFADVAAFGAWLDAVQGGWLVHVFRSKASGEVLGMASYMRADPANGVVEVGGVAHGSAMSRTPIATEVHYLMARHVFDDLGYRRYEWKCHNDNAASKTAARRYGFTFEGVFRQHMVSKGGNRDTAWFSIIDSEWPVVKAAFETWLSPGNFDESGHQLRRMDDIRAELAGETAA
ncbi:GNAT family protein [Rhizobium sp. RU36D]|uniref:GNAT family N-acetyltransferase n=1 Tax=Rhizobium sp. RU36D TaxID=1907415 RepID=UPI0009D89F04|nr:GNAT family protein [Rhizobium sp. RU36D]SMC43359.1 Protein N-acetyltransferase, RimJ/RimL family [Rhizobium sp. RU36D]